MPSLSFGQYHTGTSALHRLNGFTKLMCFFLLLAAIILTNSLLGYLLLATVFFLLLSAAKIPFRTALAPLRHLWLFFLFILLMNAFFFETENALWSFWIFHLSKSGILQGVHVVLKVLLVMLCASALTAVTSSLELMKAIEALLAPLSRLHLPTRNIAMILSVSLQFIPTLLEEADTVKKAQLARGASFEGTSLRHRAKSILPLILPIFLAAFRHADTLSVAMEARGYRTTKRKKAKKLSLQKRDFLALALMLSVCLVQFIL